MDIVSSSYVTNKNLKFASPWSYVYFKQVSYGIIKLIVTD